LRSDVKHRGWQLATGLMALVAASTSHAATGRTETDLDAGWRFVRQDEPDAQQPTFDDAAWQAVSLPHTWNNLDGQDGGNNYYRGPGWYRRHLDLRDRAASLAGRTLVLRFGAASRVADVFVNGAKVGQHRGCFGAFTFDVTHALRLDGDNVIAVRVDNTTVPDVAPLSADFTFFGGLYRDVSLLDLPAVAVSPFDDGSSGVYVSQSNVSAENATVSVKVELSNATGSPHATAVLAEVLDADGKQLAGTKATTLVTGATGEVTPPAIVIDHPYLWDGRADPHLYHVRVTVDDGDAVTVPLGLRSYSVSADHGMLLNGKPFAVHGVSRHQDRRDKGWAIGPAEQAEDFAMIMDVGATAVRFAHYEQAPMAYDLCDRDGLVVWSEVPIVNRITPGPAFADNAEQQLREMVKQNYNHPCVCFWGLFNELGNQISVAGQKAQHDDQISLIKRLNTVAHKLDPGRLTTCATTRSPGDALNFITDVLAFNDYPGWYDPDIAKFPAFLDTRHKVLAGRAMGISEYGVGANINQHSVLPTKAPKTTGQWHPEEWQNNTLEQVYPMMASRPWVWGSFVWNMFEFVADDRHEGGQPGINDKGLVTYDRRLKKDAYFYYKAIWSTDPFVYVTDRRFTPRPVDRGPVKVYSNTAAVELFVNGRSLGSRTPTAPGVFTWPDVQLARGDNTLRAVTKSGQKDECGIVVDPAAQTHAPGPATRTASVSP
jgi:beta-galactosidase